MKIDELHAQGHTRMRLPFWNKFAFADLYIDPDTGRLGPWVTVTDVTGSFKVFIGEADWHDEWEPWEPVLPDEGKAS